MLACIKFWGQCRAFCLGIPLRQQSTHVQNRDQQALSTINASIQFTKKKKGQINTLTKFSRGASIPLAPSSVLLKQKSINYILNMLALPIEHHFFTQLNPRECVCVFFCVFFFCVLERFKHLLAANSLYPSKISVLLRRYS